MVTQYSQKLGQQPSHPMPTVLTTHVPLLRDRRWACAVPSDAVTLLEKGTPAFLCTVRADGLPLEDNLGLLPRRSPDPKLCWPALIDRNF